MKLFRKTIRGVKRMTAADEIKDNAHFLKNYTKALYGVGKSEHKGEGQGQPKSFTEAGYTDRQLAGARDTFKKYFVIYSVAFALAAIYMLAAFLHGDIRLGLVALAFVLVCLAQTFRYHFWLFQIRKNKLGCTFQEWFHSLFKRSTVSR